MKIIKQGIVKEKETKKKCYKCGTVFMYLPSDTKMDRDGKYVECPHCKAFIAVD